jgi:hypothetical protein
MECVFEELDKLFTENEIETCIKGLNRNKSPGVDNILNEYILDRFLNCPSKRFGFEVLIELNIFHCLFL